jgi:hypothetical protein
LTDVDRGAAMAASVAKAARRLGIDVEGVELINASHSHAMAPRLAQLDDDHHPAFLHPGRSILILMRDVALTDPVALATAALLESEHATLRADAGSLDCPRAEEVADRVRAVPQPGDPALAERLLRLDEGTLLAALAERLDQLRHAHLSRDLDWWRGLHEEAMAVWLPMAERGHPRLATRYGHWARSFAKRLG